tara:strand:- start:96 stop:293 length:198 start_codon:yes stop_codon:yes gene_type:complete
MKNQLLQLQLERDLLRSELKGKSKMLEFDDQFHLNSKELSRLDTLFFKLCNEQNFTLSKWGRLSK